MNDAPDTEHKKSLPTPKMLEFAKKIADVKQMALPAEVATSFEACKQFLDANANLPPSAKALAFAETIAARRGLELPDEARADGKKLSSWIDANKA